MQVLLAEAIGHAVGVFFHAIRARLHGVGAAVLDHGRRNPVCRQAGAAPPSFDLPRSRAAAFRAGSSGGGLAAGAASSSSSSARRDARDFGAACSSPESSSMGALATGAPWAERASASRAADLGGLT